MNKTVTLVIRGTFAGHAKWWRLGSEGYATFADRLSLGFSVWRTLVQDFEVASLAGLERKSTEPS